MSRSSRVLGPAAPIALPVAALVLLLDQLTKHWALNALQDGPTDVVWTLRFNLAFNSGMAFSRGRGLGPIIGVVALVVIVAMIIGVAGSRGVRRSWGVPIGMILGGAAGNIADRLFRGDGWLRGSVVDFIDLQWWPIFNIADVGVTVGGIWLVTATWLAGRHEPSTPEGAAVDHDSTPSDEGSTPVEEDSAAAGEGATSDAPGDQPPASVENGSTAADHG